ncbi:hypothetical protein H6M51_11720 [Rhizobium sp. AQ_MP]|uniref:hypothetical protein n=1 Tax=Rhizobium sp. AQ_MP TaxID=2761536 RepID=UPI001639C9C0|nr:hypothetical protein [Rhizobium sp. AQ_MP]MBC2773535.1 hypothetical protein [Rhizobium sp. AQ_MP]
MTTEPDIRRTAVQRLVRSGAVLLGIVGVWFSALAASTAILGPVGPAVLVLGSDIPARLPDGAGILRANGGRTIVSAPDAAFVRSLYAHGAWLVLPALRNGCMDLRPA